MTSYRFLELLEFIPSMNFMPDIPLTISLTIDTIIGSKHASFCSIYDHFLLIEGSFFAADRGHYCMLIDTILEKHLHVVVRGILDISD